MLEESEDRQTIRKLRDELREYQQRILSQSEIISDLRKELAELRAEIAVKSLNGNRAIRRNRDSVRLRTDSDER
jgi:ribosomal protein L29